MVSFNLYTSVTSCGTCGLRMSVALSVEGAPLKSRPRGYKVAKNQECANPFLRFGLEFSRETNAGRRWFVPTHALFRI